MKRHLGKLNLGKKVNRNIGEISDGAYSCVK